MLVSPEVMRATANQLEVLRETANATLTSYLNAAHDVNSAGAWNGPASTGNVVSSEEIHQAQNELTVRWQQTIDALRNAANVYESQEENAAAQTSAIV